MNTFETKQLGGIEIEVKADTDKRIIKGYASIFGNVDSDGDLIEQGAFQKSIAEKFSSEGRSRIKMMSQHQTFIGRPILMREDAKGLYVEGKVSKTRAGDEALELVDDGVWDEMSIGFVTRRYEDVRDDDDRQTGVKRLRRVLKELDLWEFGPLAWGANAATSAEAQKGDWLLDTLMQVKQGRVLSKANMSRLQKAMDLIDEVVNEAKAAESSESTQESDGSDDGAKAEQDQQDEKKSQAVDLLAGINDELGRWAQALRS